MRLRFPRFLSLFLLLACTSFAWGQALPENLVQALGSTDDLRARQKAIAEIASMGDPAIEPLKGLLANADPWTRAGAMEALGRIPNDRCTEILINVMETSEKRMRVFAATALGGQKNRRAVDALMQAVHPDTPQHADVKVAAIKSLGAIGDPRSGMFLVRVLASQMHPACGMAASTALKEMTGREFGVDIKSDLKWIAENRPEWQKQDPKKKGLSRGYLSLVWAVIIFAVLGFGAVIKGWRNYR